MSQDIWAAPRGALARESARGSCASTSTLIYTSHVVENSCALGAYYKRKKEVGYVNKMLVYGSIPVSRFGRRL